MTARYRIGFDIGGTFTDFILLDTARNDIRLHKCLTTPAGPLRRRARGAGGDRRRRRDRGSADVAEIVHGTTLGDQRADRAARRETRAHHDRGVPRHARDGHRAALRHLRSVPAISRAAGARAAIASKSRSAWTATATRSSPLDLDAVRAAARALVDDGIEAIAIGFLHAYRNPAHERAAADGDPRAVPRRRGVALVGGGRGAVGVSAADDDLRQRVRAAADGPLHPPAGARAVATRVPWRAHADALGGRSRLAGNRARLPDPPARIRPRGRRPRDGVLRRRSRASAT